MYKPRKNTIILPITKKEVTIREPLVRDQLAVAHIDNDIERGIALISNLTEIPKEELEELPIVDFETIDKEVDKLMSMGKQ